MERTSDSEEEAAKVAEPRGPAGDDVLGEARWPMAGAVLAAIVLTILLPDAVRVGPRWLLPVVEGVLLVMLVVADPVTISRRSRELRSVSIVLVFVLVLATLWSTGLLIHDLIEGGPETNSASDLLQAGVGHLAFQHHRLLYHFDHSSRAQRRRCDQHPQRRRGG